jgi:hypothetical protein
VCVYISLSISETFIYLEIILSNLHRKYLMFTPSSLEG